MLRRHLAGLLRRSLGDFPAVLLLGARQVGKSTLAMQLVEDGLLDRYVTLDDLAALQAARADPDRFVAETGDRVALDEVQREPDLMRALKRSIDLRRASGRFLLTGSANVLSRPEVAESLAGRIDVVTLDGLSAAELDGRPSRLELLDVLLAPHPVVDFVAKLRDATRSAPPLRKDEFNRRIFFGGFPDVAIRNEVRFATRWFGSYVTTYVERDVRNLARLPDMVSFGRFMRLCGLRTANLLNVANVAVDAGIDHRTATRYLELLDVTFQTHRLLPWHANTTRRLVKSPKIYLRDSGLACHFAGVDDPDRLSGHPASGALLETWFLAELRKLLAQTTGVELSFFRTHGGREVDFVVEKGHAMLGLEVKRAASVGHADFAGLQALREVAGDRCRGLLLYLGDEVVPFGPGLIAAPMRAFL